MAKFSVHDRPPRAQAKLMNLKHANAVDDLVRTLPPREATVMQASALAPHLISITASGDARLRVPSNVLATNLAMRLSVTQIPTTPTTGAATEGSRFPGGMQKTHAEYSSRNSELL